MELAVCGINGHFKHSLVIALISPSHHLLNVSKYFFLRGVDTKTQRTHGRQAQIGNIAAARAVADIIRSTLGPRSMLKVRKK